MISFRQEVTTMKSLAEARIKRTRAVELAAQGMSYDDIATAVGQGHC